jgi:hypothetical protein
LNIFFDLSIEKMKSNFFVFEISKVSIENAHIGECKIEIGVAPQMASAYLF